MNILNPYTWLAGALILALVGGSGYLYGREDGKKIERTDWQKKENADLAAAVKERDKLRKEAEDHADALAAISGHYQGELKNERIKKDRVISELRAGTVRLRDPNGKCAGIGIALPETDTGAGGRDGSSGTELPGSSVGVLSSNASEFLIGEASRADEIARQLTACQGVVRADRR